MDGSASSRWWARSTSTQWLQVDLGNSYNLNRVVINWYSDYARAYRVQVSGNGTTWTTVKDVTNGRGGREEQSLTSTSARFVRIECRTANGSNGFAITELEIYP